MPLIDIGDECRRGAMKGRWLRCLVASALLSHAWGAEAAIVECADARGVQILTTVGNECGVAAGTRTPARRRASDAGTPTPAAFPRVDAATQRTRDDDRVRILQDELDQQQQRLVALQAAAPDRSAGPSERDSQVSRTIENIRALKSELSRRF